LPVLRIKARILVRGGSFVALAFVREIINFAVIHPSVQEKALKAVAQRGEPANADGAEKMSDALRALSELGNRVDARMLQVLAVGASKSFQEVIFHQVKAGGKRIRPALTVLFCEAAGGQEKDALTAAAAIELVHNYSLICDDIIDDADVRRNVPTTWKKFGLSFGILAAIHYREAIEEAVLQSPDPLIISRLVADGIRELIEGERLDILFEQVPKNVEYVDSHRFKQITRSDYETMVGGKTASLLRTACEVGVVCAKGSDALRKAAREFGWKAGIAFQMADDVLDLFAAEAELGKRVGKDIYEHKLGNAVILQAMEQLPPPDRKFLLDLLHTPKPTEKQVAKAIELLRSCGAADQVKKRTEQLVNEARQSLSRFPNQKACKMLEGLVAFISQRTF
jgi:geranylgeranyl diphosphate synthase type I